MNLFKKQSIYKEDLRRQFEEETGMHWKNSQDEPDIEYVTWLEHHFILFIQLHQNIRNKIFNIMSKED